LIEFTKVLLSATSIIPSHDGLSLYCPRQVEPCKINMASAGSGSLTHMFGELFNMIGGVNLLHIPYRGESAAIADLLGGQVQVSFPTLLGSIEHIRDKNLRALAVTTGTRRYRMSRRWENSWSAARLPLGTTQH
jgi:tripartite-type tricarboxylate transporter receptor subunit TctC